MRSLYKIEQDSKLILSSDEFKRVILNKTLKQ